MYKYYLTLILCGSLTGLILLGFGCSDKSEMARLIDENYEANQKTKNTEPTELDKFKDEVVLKDIPPSSINFKLLGRWQDNEDPTYVMELTSTKFKNYLDGEQNWDMTWTLVDSKNQTEAKNDYNGRYMFLYFEGKVHFIYKVEEVSMSLLHITSEADPIKGYRATDRTFKRIE